MNFLLSMLSFGAVLSGILVISAKNPVISVLFLISVFINVAGYLILLGVAYMGLVYIIVYVGAIAILFLFVVMMLNLRLVELTDTGKTYTQNLPLGFIMAVSFLFEVISMHSHTFTNVSGLPMQAYNVINSLLMDSSNSPVASTYVHTTFAPVSADVSYNSYLQVQSIGMGLYTYSTLWLVIASFILLLSMIGPIVLCMNPSVPALPGRKT